MNAAALTQWFEAREPREQRVLVAGGMLTVLILVGSTLLWLNGAVTGASAQVQRKQADLAFLREAAPRLAAAGSQPSAPAAAGGESIVVLVDRSARESGLGQSLGNSQPGGDGSLRVQFEKADFNTWTAWLARLVTQHGVRVESVTVDAAGEPGIVNATAIVRLRP